MQTNDQALDLTEELSNQIEYNNALLQQMQEMEQKFQDKNRALMEKDHELRSLRQEFAKYKSQQDNAQQEFVHQMNMSNHDLEDLSQQVQALQQDKSNLLTEQQRAQERYDALCQEVCEFLFKFLVCRCTTR